MKKLPETQERNIAIYWAYKTGIKNKKQTYVLEDLEKEYKLSGDHLLKIVKEVSKQLKE